VLDPKRPIREADIATAEEGALRHRFRSLGESVASHSRQIVIAIYYAKLNAITKSRGEL
jgi:hypothetical protein